MKWRIGIVAVVVFLGAGQALADYLQLIVDVNNATPTPKALTMSNQPGQPGGVPAPGAIPGQGGFPGQGFPGQLPRGKKGTNQFRPPPMQQAPLPVPGNAAAVLETYREPLWAIVYLEMRGKPDASGGVAVKIDHQFGKNTYIPVLPWREPEPPPFIQPERIQKESLAGEHAKKLNKLKDTPKTKEMVDLAGWAWSHGLMKEFHATIDELKKQDSKHPVVAAYLKVQKQLKAPLPEDDPAVKGILQEAKAEGYRSLGSDKGHYALFTNLPPGSDHDAPVKRRLLRLEEEMESFYYWFAIQENVPIPAMPRYRLLGILVNEPVEFYKKNLSWGSPPMVGEGFTPPRDNIMILSANRLDEAYTALEQKNRGWQQTIRANPEELLTGSIWRRPDAKGPNAMPYAIIQTLTVVQKAMEDEAERTTLTHEAARQLLAASGLLPHNVVAPEWIREGLAAYFERPFGAVYGGGGLPSWSNLIAYKYQKTQGLGKGREILLNVLTDRYFQEARNASMNLEDPREKMTEKLRDRWERARGTSWALVYYLVKVQKMDRLLTYANEVAQMPRDLDLDLRSLEGSFAKAFGLGEAKNALKLDQGLLEAFADTWSEFMTGVNLEVPEVQVVSMEFRRSLAELTGMQGPPRKGGPPPGKMPPGKGPPPPPPPGR